MKKILLLAMTALLWTACSDDDSCNRKATDPNQIQLSALITTVKPSSATAGLDTRTAITGSTAAWINGDALGLYCTQSTPASVNNQFTVSGIGTTPVWAPSTAIYWTDGTTDHQFLAYAPYASGNSDPAAVKIPALNVQTGTINPAQDLLISNNMFTNGVSRTTSVGLVFSHAFALIELDVLGTGLAAGATLVSTVIAGGTSDKLYTSDANSTIALVSGAITVTTGVNTATVTPTTPPAFSGTALPIYTLIVPGTYTTPTLTVNIKEGATTVTTATIPLGTTTFAAGSKYTYQVTVSRTAIKISNPTITDWTNVTGSPITPGI